jgi:hypothetical protein
MSKFEKDPTCQFCAPYSDAAGSRGVGPNFVAACSGCRSFRYTPSSENRSNLCVLKIIDELRGKEVSVEITCDVLVKRHQQQKLSVSVYSSELRSYL